MVLVITPIETPTLVLSIIIGVIFSTNVGILLNDGHTVKPNVTPYITINNGVGIAIGNTVGWIVVVIIVPYTVAEDVPSVVISSVWNIVITNFSNNTYGTMFSSAIGVC